MSPPGSEGTQPRSLILARAEISALMRPADWLAAVETGFRAAGLGLPAIQGAILLCDGETGAVVAILDSIEVMLRRTAAATMIHERADGGGHRLSVALAA